MGIRVRTVPALDDNYMYVIVDEATKTAGVVDPVDPAAVLRAAAEEGATVTHIFTTHSHWDHAGGNIELLKRCPTIVECYGGVGDGVAGCTKEVREGDVLALGESRVGVLETPCHTQGHVCYTVDGNVFTGDTLFVSGAGNFNRGTPAQMVAAFDKILALPDDTQVWVGHEYTLKNCKFAYFCEPCDATQSRLAWAERLGSLHRGGRGTVPSTIAAEKAANPFARIDQLTIRSFAGGAED
eukprot:CAMPEP_0119261272 /NCGR_PEP_ID=MMETSP1329-20130426/1397_1 /TAXON_ID=114041 /ORGANISM="Genus nov. species nov., Strain RCC1024" /LENGTH=239 /DNA_ID=CAMNT_0007260813 /DNA_START=303 /DNA_END=1019 /DNA_ORIENTATION=+